MPSVLRDITNYLAPGWKLNAGSGYYTHRGRAYTMGELISVAPNCGATLFTGLPSEVRPASPVAVSLRLDPIVSDDSANPTYGFQTWWPSTVHPDGSWTLDAAPPAYVNAAPSDPALYWKDLYGVNHPQYPAPVQLGLIFGNLQWPIAASIDQPSYQSLAPLLNLVSVTDVDSRYSAHDGRVHVTGRVISKSNNSGFVTYQSPASPGFMDGVSYNYGGNRLILGGHPAMLLPTENAIEILASIAATRAPNQSRCLSDQSPVTNGGAALNGGNITTGPFGFKLPQAGTVLQGGVKWEGVTVSPTYHQCEFYYNGVAQPGFTFSCPDLQLGEVNLSVDVVNELLSQIAPAPDWFTLTVFTALNVSERSTTTCDVPVTGIGGEGGCGPQYPVQGIPVIGGSGGTPVGPTGVGTPVIADANYSPTDGTTNHTQYFAAIPPPSSLYVGPTDFYLHYGTSSPAINSSTIMWRRDQATGATITAQVGSSFNNGQVYAQVQLRPFWEMRNDGLLIGEAVDFGDGGWPGTDTVGAIDIGPARSGAHRLDRRIP